MAQSYTRYTGDGATTDRTTPSNYLDQDDIVVSVNGVTQTLTTHYSWLNASTIRFVSAPASGAVILIERSTSRATRLVNWTTPSNMSDEDLDNDSLQAFYMAQEAIDVAERALIEDLADGKYNAQSKKIKNHVDPGAAQDAATKNYVDTELADVLDDVAAEADAAAASATAAAGSASTATTQATTATTQAGLATAARSGAETAEDGAETAQAAAEAAQAAAEDAVTSVALPVGVANTLLVRNAGNTAYDAKTFAQTRTLLDLEAGTDFNAFSERLKDIASDITWAQGDIIYFDGTSLVNLAPGTSGQFLQTLGAAANPAWAALTAFETGDIAPSYRTSKSGWVLADGRTIGDASSGATNRADADTAALFSVLWTNLANAEAAVSGGRGASAVADFAAHKTIALPDHRGRAIVGKDDMSGTSANRLTVAGSGLDGDVLGKTGGAETHTLTTAQMPAHTHTETAGQVNAAGGITGVSADASGSTGSTGGGGAHNNTQPSIVANIFIKL